MYFYRDLWHIRWSFLFPTDHILWAYEGTLNLGLWIAVTMRNRSWNADELIISQRHSWGGSVMGWCHSCVSSLPQPILLSIQGDTTWSSFLFSIVLHFVLANSCSAEPKLLWQGDGLVGGWRAVHRHCSLCLFHYIVASWYFYFIWVFCIYFFACLVLRYPGVEINSGHRVVAPCCFMVMFSNINGLHGNLRELCSCCFSVWHCRLFWNKGYTDAACG